MTKEIWRAVVRWEDCYEVSDRGRVRSIDRVVTFADGRVRAYRGQLLSQYLGVGYPRVTLKRNGDFERAHVHILLAAAFIGPCPDGLEVCHNDGQPLNCTRKNLRYDTHAGNLADCRKHGTATRPTIQKFSDETVAAIRAARGTEPQVETARRFGISRAHCCNIQNGNRR